MSSPVSPDSSPTESPTDQPSPDLSTGARVLKGGAAVFALLGSIMATWMADKWIDDPGMKASQFDFSAPLWPAATVFVVLATAAGVTLLWHAARRAESGEDLFAQRHRRGLEEAKRSETDRSEP